MRRRWNNLRTAPSRWMMRYLQRRGWIVFYWQDKSTLRCHDPHCILTLYLDQRKHGEPYA